MLTASKAMMADQASGYFQKDNYWLKDSHSNQFIGNTINYLSINNEKLNSKEQFQAIFEALSSGIDPKNPQEILTGKGPGKERRAGWDFTFSAPKTVSILYEIAGDRKLYDAHQKAVEKVISYAQEHFSQTRITKEGKTEIVTTGNLAIAQFNHHTSRELDPQLHTHNFIFNLTKCEDGKFRALEPKELYKHQHLMSHMYQNELAKSVRQLGYEVEWSTGKNGSQQFDIKGIPDNIKEQFSKRSNQVSAKLEKLRDDPKYQNLSEEKLREIASIDSRKAKSAVTQESMRQEWNKQLDELDADKDKLILNAKSIEKNLHVNHSIDEILDYTLDSVSDKTSVFDQHQVFEQAYKISKGVYSHSELQKAFNARQYEIKIAKNKFDIIKLNDGKYTTKEMYDTEQNIFKNIDKGKNSFEPIMKKEEILLGIDTNLTIGQAKAVEDMLCSTDSLMGIQGDAGTGKTYMLKNFKEMAAENINIVGLAYTGKAAAELENESGIHSQTLDSYLLKKDAPSDKRELLIVDEASMLNTKKLDQLLNKASRLNAQVALIGDIKQLQAIGQGNMFTRLQELKKVDFTIMDKSLRQKNAETKEIVNLFKDRYIDQAIDKIDKTKRLHINKNIANLTDDIIKSASEKMSKYGLNTSAVLVNTNTERNQINYSIRKILQDNGVVQKDEHNIKTRKQRSMDLLEKRIVDNYKESDILVTTKMTAGIKPGTELEILQIKKETNQILVGFEYTTKKGQIFKATKNLNMAKNGHNLVVYQEEENEFSKGDKIVFEKNSTSFKNGETAIIKSIEDKNITVIKNDKEYKIDTNSYNYFSHGYALTAYKAQGQSIDSVYILADSNLRNMNNMNNGYVFLSRAKHEIHLFTDDSSRLRSQFENEQDKENVVDYIQERFQKDNIRRPSIKQMKYANKLSSLYEQDIPKDALDNREKLTNWTKELSSKPTSKQTYIIDKVSQSTGIIVDEELDLRSANAWIQENNNKASVKQMNLVEKLSNQLDIEYKDVITRKDASLFIQKNLEALEYKRVGISVQEHDNLFKAREDLQNSSLQEFIKVNNFEENNAQFSVALDEAINQKDINIILDIAKNEPEIAVEAMQKVLEISDEDIVRTMLETRGEDIELTDVILKNPTVRGFMFDKVSEAGLNISTYELEFEQTKGNLIFERTFEVNDDAVDKLSKILDTHLEAKNNEIEKQNILNDFQEYLSENNFIAADKLIEKAEIDGQFTERDLEKIKEQQAVVFDKFAEDNLELISKKIEDEIKIDDRIIDEIDIKEEQDFKDRLEQEFKIDSKKIEIIPEKNHEQEIDFELER